MSFWTACFRVFSAALCFFLLDFSSVGLAAEYKPGSLRKPADLLASRLRSQIEKLPLQAQARAVAWLGNHQFTDEDLKTLHVDAKGGIFYADSFDFPPVGKAEPDTKTALEAASIPVGPLSQDLILHSKPGAPNTLYLNFSGEVITGTAWNDVYSRLEAVPFSIDSDYTTFNDAEQLAIKRVWQRVAEDYAPFNIDVTTERPSSFTATTAHALITRSTDASGQSNPSAGSGGVAYLGVFGSGNYSTYRPAWVYFDALASQEMYIADAVSHEVGHNMGLSHDGTTDGGTYYRGHGDGETSWAPIMGSSYYRNVSQWSKGEYHLANNNQDDLALITAKLPYRSDDHGNTAASATPLAVTDGTVILSTNPESDPGRTNTSNKGIIERNTDIDVFSFGSGSGAVDLYVTPWVMPTGNRGGNVDLAIELRSANGVIVASDNPPATTTARIRAVLNEGIYYLHVRSTGAGDPTSATPTGYTAYGSVGQYFITGAVVRSTIAIPPGAELQVTDVTQPGTGSKPFTVTYTDNTGISVATLDDTDIFVTGPNSYVRPARLVSVNQSTDGTPRIATYAADAPDGVSWSPRDNGSYAISVRSNQVADTEGAFVPSAILGSFNVSVPQVVYLANLDNDPGWSLQGLWQYGNPAYAGNGPTSGFTGPRILAYNLSGPYENNLSAKYATTPAINCSSAASLTLRFQRWLRLRNGDWASIQISADGSSWTDLWSTTRAVSDAAWQSIEIPLPAWANGNPSLQLRWGISSGSSQNDIGWNLDDVQLVATTAGTDTTPPVASLQAANIVDASSNAHPINVAFTDDVAVRVSTLGHSNLLITGPASFAAPASFIAVDVALDGTPRTANYAVPAPGGAWDAADNGTYQVILQHSQVSDVAGNFAPSVLLGEFTVALVTNSQALLPSTTNLVVPEGGTATFTLSLAEPPLGDLPITVERLNGPTNLVLTDGGSYTFASFNWSNGVTVTVLALPDFDRLNSAVTFQCFAPGLPPVLISATEQDATPEFQLEVTSANTNWGTVNISGGAYPAGNSVQVTAVPAPYFHFVEWVGTHPGSNNPMTLVIDSNIAIEALFAEDVTLNHSVPHWWLATHGHTNNFEAAELTFGVNGHKLWESYLAGLDPLEASSQLRLTVETGSDSASHVLRWSPVTNRLYTILRSSNPTGPFEALPRATDIPHTTNSFTIRESASLFFRLLARKP